MSKIVFLFSLFLSVHILACKCEPLNIEKSFENADFVFIGNVEDVKQTPSGFKKLQNFISRVKIEKIFKSEQFDGFYQNQATLFSSQIASCDYQFNKNGKYLIFGHIDSDTGFIFSHICLATKPLDQTSSDDLKQLEQLAEKFKQELKAKDNQSITVKPYIEDSPDRMINDLKLKIVLLESENKKLEGFTLFFGIAFIVTFVILMIKRIYRKK